MVASRHGGLFSRNEGRKRNKEKHTALGLCIRCSKKAIKGDLRCRKHILQDRKKAKLWRAKARRERDGLQ